MNYNEIEKSITATVGEMSVNDRSTLVNMLQSSGSMVTEDTPQRDLLDATFKAIKDNKRFRDMMKEYIVTQAQKVEVSSDTNEEATFADDNYYSNLSDSKALVNRSNWRALINKGTFVDDSRYSNEDGTATKPKTSTTSTKWWQSIVNTDTLTKAVGIGMDYFGTKLQNQAAKQGNQQAIDFQNAQAQVYANQAAANKAAAEAAAQAAKTGKGKNKWVVPVAIFAGVAVIGTILFIVVKRKK